MILLGRAAFVITLPKIEPVRAWTENFDDDVDRRKQFLEELSLSPR
jgi:hypothetical protein